MSEWSEWVEILWGFTKFYFKQFLKVSAFYLEKQKSFISKKNSFWAVVNIKTKTLCLPTQSLVNVLVCLISFLNLCFKIMDGSNSIADKPCIANKRTQFCCSALHTTLRPKYLEIRILIFVYLHKVEKIWEYRPLSSVKIQIIGGKVYLR